MNLKHPGGKALAATALILAAAPVVAGCQPAGGGTLPCPAPAYQSGAACVFTPAPSCPPGWHQVKGLCVDGANSIPVIFFPTPTTPPPVGSDR